LITVGRARPDTDREIVQIEIREESAPGNQGVRSTAKLVNLKIVIDPKPDLADTEPLIGG
jgi:hypothetical protein